MLNDICKWIAIEANLIIIMVLCQQVNRTLAISFF